MPNICACEAKGGGGSTTITVTDTFALIYTHFLHIMGAVKNTFH